MSADFTLACGKVVLLDEEDLPMVSQWKWHAEAAPNTFYAVRRIKVDGKRKVIRMHRVINKTPDNLFTDHINGNGLDNRKCNIRNVEHRDNMINGAQHKIGYSKFRGVTWHKRNNFWVAQISHHYKNIYIGRFDTQEEAAIAFEAKRQELRAGMIMRAQESI